MEIDWMLIALLALVVIGGLREFLKKVNAPAKEIGTEGQSSDVAAVESIGRQVSEAGTTPAGGRSDDRVLVVFSGLALIGVFITWLHLEGPGGFIDSPGIHYLSGKVALVALICAGGGFFYPPLKQKQALFYILSALSPIFAARDFLLAEALGNQVGMDIRIGLGPILTSVMSGMCVWVVTKRNKSSRQVLPNPLASVPDNRKVFLLLLLTAGLGFAVVKLHPNWFSPVRGGSQPTETNQQMLRPEQQQKGLDSIGQEYLNCIRSGRPVC